MKALIRRIGLPAVVLIVIALIVFAYIGYYNGLVEEVSTTGASEQADLNGKITTCACFAELMTTYSEKYLASGGATKDAEEFGSIIYYAATNEYHMDGTKGAEYSTKMGNITGIGPIPQSGTDKAELNLTISYNDYFSEFYRRLPEITWIYYTSENGFIFMYPWVSSTDFKYSEDLKKVAFYSVATPENNRFREAVWTPVYLDAASKGTMITLSSPVYFGDDFKGVLSLDLTTDVLRDILQSNFDGYIVDGENNVISASKQSEAGSNIISLKDYTGLTDSDIQAVSSAKHDVVQKIGNHYIYKTRLYDAPWTLLIVVPLYSVVGKALVLTLPEIIIGILLLFGYFVLMNLQKAESLLEKASLTDPLTGLNNRRYLDAMIEKEIARVDRYKENLSMASLDLDRFKKVNDTWGHPIGDEVLKLVSNVVKNSIRKSDVLVRLGGEEFAILLPHTDIAAAHMVAEKTRQAIEEASHPIAGKVTASFGIAERQSGETYNSLYRRVDKALYRAKELGRNCVIAYEENADISEDPAKIEWNSAWDCGENNIDLQHRELLKLGNKLIETNPKDKEEIRAQLDDIIKLTVEHFKFEEQVLKSIAYPDLESHAAAHKKLVEKAIEKRDLALLGTIKLSTLFFFLMDEVLAGHMLEEDIKFFPYIKK